ncbi:MAG: peptide deformylase [Candidatus Tectomicrobia bacterium]|uniref:Peptide deformylase n=1 Tax=Tectimicrobiota bacterium TaxID=2528274 RepID=A0A932GPI1_UNCTE|nr:peptide deformylase [Candidatus Tectomicrobia bacterium]
MPAQTILLYPDPRLKEISAPVTAVTAEIRSIVRNLLDTMKAHPGSVGIAAPQIGELKRIIVVDVSGHKRAGNHHGLLILLNPVIRERDGEQIGREGCLSIPDYTARIRRAARIRVEAYDFSFSSICIDASGFEAVALQHEIDHLNGVLFLDRVASLKLDLFPRKNYLPQLARPKE